MTSGYDEVAGFDDDHDPVLDPEALGLTSETVSDGGLSLWDALLAVLVVGAVVLVLVTCGRT